MRQRKENRSKGRLTVRRPRGRSRGQTAKRWMKTHKCVWRQSECLCIRGVASINWPKTKAYPIPANTFDHPAPRPTRKTFFAADGSKHVWQSQLLTAEQSQTELLTGSEFSRCVSFIYAGYSLCENANVCACVCFYIGVRCIVWPEWLVEQQKTCLSRRSKLSMDLTVARHDVEKKPQNKGCPNWCMTCVAFRHRERLSWCVQRRRFCYRFNFVTTFIVHEWEWASCQPQCPLSQFHCPRCDHGRGGGGIVTSFHTLWS